MEDKDENEIKEYLNERKERIKMKWKDENASMKERKKNTKDIKI